MRKIMKWCCVCALLILAGAAGFVWGRYSYCANTDISTAVHEEAAADPMEIFRAERQQLRQLQLSQLNEIIHSEQCDAKIVALAQQRQIELMEWSEQEFTLESLLSLRGFTDPFITVHTDSVNVLLRAETVSRQESALILEIVMRETGISGGNVKIIPVK